MDELRSVFDDLTLALISEEKDHWNEELESMFSMVENRIKSVLK